MTDIEENLFDAFWATYNLATDQGIAQSSYPDPASDFREALRYNNAVFAAFKVHRMQNDMAALLLDENGDLKPFEQWMKDVQPIASHQCERWLRTEYDTAVIRAHQAADWQQFQREKDVLPNLRWMPSTSLHPGADHKIFWDTVRPVDDPFWDQHRPGDRWNCKCTLSSTDDPETPVPTIPNEPAPPTGTSPHAGLDNNPGKDGKIFSDSHPYIANAYQGAKKAVNRFIKKLKKDGKKNNKRLKQIRRQAAALKARSLKNAGFPNPVVISNTAVKEWLNQPHLHYRQKNEALLSIHTLFAESEYIGYTTDNRKDVVKSHIFETTIAGDKSWIIVHQMTWGEYKLYSVSDSPKIQQTVKK